jgi:mRNA interferase YafQ
MLTIRRTTQFKKDFKRELRGRHGKVLEEELRATIGHLFSGQPMPARYVDHSLAGEWKDYRDCHIKPDLVLIYRWDTDGTLALVRLGSHSELGI